MRKVLKFLLFLSLLVLLVGYLSAITTPSLDLSERKIEYKSSLYQGNSFGDMPKGSIDVVFIGSSHIYSSVSPMEMWDEYGIVGYNCTSSGQYPWTTYYYLKQALEYQHPKVVVVDLYGAFTGSVPDELSNRSALDYMPLSINKLKLAYITWKHQKGGENLFSYIIPVIRFHSRWNELTETDMRIKENYDYTRGYDIRYGNDHNVNLKIEDFPFLRQSETDDMVDYNEEALEYYKKMHDVCEEANVELLFIKTPVSGYTIEKRNTLDKISRECEVPFIDFNSKEMWEKMGYDIDTDTLDTEHLNYSGAKKFSKLMGAILKDGYGLPDHRNDKNYDFWNQDYEIYREQVKINNIIRTHNSKDYWSIIKNENYILLLVGNQRTDEYVAKKIGLQNDQISNMWLATKKGKKKEITYEGSLIGKLGKTPYIIDSSGIYVAGKNYLRDAQFTNYLLYDCVLEKIVDWGTIDDKGNIIR